MTDTPVILLADDSPEELRLVEHLLRREGYGVRVAATGADALREAAVGGVDLILLDYRLDDIDGVEVCRRLKGAPETQGIPVVMVSGVAETDVWAEGLRAGVADYVAKPFRPEELLMRIRTQIALGQALGDLRRSSAELEHEVAARSRVEEQLRNGLQRAERSRRALLSILEDQKLVGDSLRSSEERFRLLVESAPDALFVQTDLCFAYVNEAAVRLFGARSPAELLGASVLDRMHPEFRDVVRDRIRLLNEEKTPVPRLEQRYLRMDNTEVPVEVSAVPIRYQGRDGAIVFVRDITDRKRADALVAVRVRLLERAATGSREDVTRAVLDEAETLTGSLIGFYHLIENEQTLSMQTWSTRTQEEFCTGLQSMGHHDVSEAGVWFDCAREHQAVVHNDYASLAHRRGLPDGHSPLIREAMAPVVRDGKVVAVMGLGNKPTDYGPEDLATISYLADIAYEIAARKHAEEVREQLQTQLQQSLKMESIGRLAGGIAHDFNNMLMVVLGGCERLDRIVGRASAEAAEVARVRAAAKRGAALTRQLLSFSRKQPVRPESLDLNEVMSDIQGMLLRLIGEDIDMVMVRDPGPCCAKADRSQLEQAIVNIVVNARDAMPDGGKLTIETRRVDLGEEYVRTHAEVSAGPYTMLAVSDTGVGMDEETRLRVFEPFFTTKAPGTGTGLGLPSVYGAIRQAGGHVQIYSEVGVGTTVRLYLPETDEAPAHHVDRPEAADVRGNGQSILVVEDAAPLRSLLKSMLLDLGYNPTLASDGSEALDLIDRVGFRPDLVLTDVVMPIMSGAVLAQRLRERMPDVKVLFMSGYTDNAIVHHGVLDAGTPYLPKPFSSADLASAVAKLLMSGPADSSARRVLMIDDDADITELAQIACRRHGHTLVGARNRKAAFEALATTRFDVALIDMNIPGASGPAILKQMRQEGHTVPAVFYTGAGSLVNVDDYAGMGLIGVIEKSADFGPLIDVVESIPRAV